MKKLLSFVMCVVMLAVPVLGAQAENPSVLDELWGSVDFSFLADWGVLTAEEAAMLVPDKAAVENGREVVRAFTLGLGSISGVPEEDALLNELLSRVTFINRSQRHEEALEVLLDGETLLTLGYGESAEGYRLSSNLLGEAIAFTAADLEKLSNRLVTAAQNNGLVTSEQAMQFGMMTATMPSSTYGMLLGMATGDYPAMAELDLTEWNAVLSDVTGRQLYTAVTEQPADCDAAVEMWTLTVTGADVTNLVRAALITLRDNPDLTLALSEALGLQDMAYLYDMSGNVLLDEVVSPALAELEGVEERIPMEVQLTAWENAEGEIVRMEIMLLDTEEDVPALLLRVDYTRLTDGDTVTHDVVLGHDWSDYIYATFVDGRRYFSLDIGEVYMEGEADQAYTGGGRSSSLTMALAYVVNDTIPGLKSVQFQLSVLMPVSDWDMDGAGYEQMDYTLTMEVFDETFTASEQECGMCITVRANHCRGTQELMDVYGYVSYGVTGDDLTGTESLRYTVDGVTMLEYAAQVYTQEPSGSIMDGEAIHLNAFTDEELTAWLAGVAENVEAWMDNDAVHFIEEQLAEPEEDSGELTGMMFVCTEEAGQSFTWTLNADDVVAVDEEYADGTLKLHFTGLQPGKVMLTVMTMNADGVVVRSSCVFLSVDEDGIVHVTDTVHLTESGGVIFN